MGHIVLVIITGIVKWVFFPVAVIFYGVQYTSYEDWFNDHWEVATGSILGTGIAGVDTVNTLQQSKVTYDFSHDMYLLSYAVIKAVLIVLASLYAGRWFKNHYKNES